MSDLSDIRALAFDVFGTTVDWCAGIAREAEALLAPRGHSLDWVAFANRWRKEYQPAMEAVRSGKRGYVVMDVLHREMLETALGDFDIGDLGEEEKDLFALAWRRLPPWPDTVEGLARLKRRFTLVALSNGNIALISEMSKRAGLAWDVILGADIVQTYKPMPALYDSAPRLLDLRPEQVMMVACHAWDLDHAMKRGLRTAYVRRPDEFGPGVGLPDPAPGQYDVQVGSFLELADAMGA